MFKLQNQDAANGGGEMKEETKVRDISEVPKTEPGAETPEQKIQRANAELLMANQEKKKNAWEQISKIMEENDLVFSVSATLSDRRPTSFVIDIVDKPKQ
jgi:hypothetical protein